MADSDAQVGSQCIGCGIQLYLATPEQTISDLEEVHRQAHRTSGDYGSIDYIPLYKSKDVEGRGTRFVEGD